MYGPIDFLVAQEIIHIIGRDQARQEGQETSSQEQMSPIARLINRLPIWIPNQPFVLEVPHDNTLFNSTKCE